MKMSKLISGLVLGLALSGTAQAEDKKEILFGIVPQQAASKLALMWVPFINELSAKTGYKLRFATMKDIPSFEECLAQGAYDLAYMNPYHYTTFSQRAGYRAIAHQSDKMLKGIMVARKDQKIEKLAQLDGQVIAFPSPAAFGASVLPRAEMSAQGVNFDPAYVKSHDSVYRAVATGIFPAGGGVLRTFNSIPAELRDQLNIIYTTKAYTPHAFATHPTIAPDKAQKIAQAMIEIAAEKPDLVKKIGMKGFTKASDETWDDVRALSLKQEQTEIRQEGSLVCRFD